MTLKDALQILEIQEFHGVEAVKTQFRQLAHRYHPDKNPDPQQSEKFNEILKAYRFILNNITDVFHHFEVSDQDMAGEEMSARVAIDNLDDIFDDIFGFSKQGRVLGYHEPQTLYLKVSEFAHGAKKKEKLISYKVCLECQGAASQPGTVAKTCSVCFGKGTLKGRAGCPKCKGRGRLVAKPCLRCDGFGRLKQFRQLEFEIPTGLQPQEIYTLEAQDTENKQKTQLFLEPRLLRDPIFQIDKYDLLCQYHLDFNQVQLPLHLRLTTPYGKIPVTVPGGAKAGDCLVIPKQGLYQNAGKTQRGDLRLTLKSKRKFGWKSLKQAFRDFWGG